MVMRSPCCYRLSVSLLLLLSVSPALGSEPPPADFRPDRIYEPEEDTGRADRVPPECAASPKLVIAVVGATGGVGKHAVSTALSQGHRVVALARSRANLTRLEEEIWRPKYTGNGNKFENLVIGNVDMHETTAERLGAALGANSVDLVLSCMGSTKGEEKVVAKATKKLLEVLNTLWRPCIPPRPPPPLPRPALFHAPSKWRFRPSRPPFRRVRSPRLGCRAWPSLAR